MDKLYAVVFFSMVFSMVSVDSLKMPLRSTEAPHISCNDVAQHFMSFVRPKATPGLQIPLSPVPDAPLDVCAGSARSTGGASCCNEDMEEAFEKRSAWLLRQQVEASNDRLKSKIRQNLDHFQVYVQSSLQEAHNQTADKLSNLFNIPREAHITLLDQFFTLNKQYISGTDIAIGNLMYKFFAELFPIVYEHVLSHREPDAQPNRRFSECVKNHYREINPFGELIAPLSKRVEFALECARFAEKTLRELIQVVRRTEDLGVEPACKRGVARLQFCSMCAGLPEARPCRGFCLNVMRGCMHNVRDMSSAWDSLVTTFQNFQPGMLRRNGVQEVMMYFTGNVTDAILKAMDDAPRIYDAVRAKCHKFASQPSGTGAMKRFSTPEGLTPSVESHGISIQKEFHSLNAVLEDSKGFLQRLADGLCRVPALFDQSMDSNTCWNGTGIGKYMHTVPQNDIINQAQHNMEVRITIMANDGVLRAKESMMHLRKNLTNLMHSERMLRDQTFPVDSDSSGAMVGSSFVPTDDEDFVGGISGSGSGDRSTDIDTEEDDRTVEVPYDNGKITKRPSTPLKPTETNKLGAGTGPKGSGTGSEPRLDKPNTNTDGPTDALSLPMASIQLLLLCILSCCLLL